MLKGWIPDGGLTRDYVSQSRELRRLSQGGSGSAAGATRLMEREPVRFFTKEIGPKWEVARERLATFVRADAAGLVFVSNATTGVNTVLRSLSWAEGDEILVTTHGYPACNNAAAFVAERSGVRVVEAELPFPVQDEDELVETILAGISPRTRLAILDHITSPTALVLSHRTVGAGAAKIGGSTSWWTGPMAREWWISTSPNIGAAYYTGNCHKWLCAPKGVAFLWVREDRRSQIRPLSISHGAKAPAHCRFHREF